MYYVEIPHSIIIGMHKHYKRFPQRIIDLFPNILIEMQQIKGELGEMKIELNLDSNPIKARPYILNPRIK